jgi:DNA-binding Lrp family transcriptional regulator
MGIAASPPSSGGGLGGTVATVTRPAMQFGERISGKSLGYDQLVDILLMSPPGETQRALARRVGYSESWLSRIIASDAFQARLAERIEKDIEPERREAFKLRFASIEEQARGLLLDSLQKLTARLEDPAGVPDQLVVKTVEVTSKLLGYGARTEQPTARVEMHVHLEQLASNVRKLNRAPINGTAVEVSAASVAVADLTNPAGDSSGQKA